MERPLLIAHRGNTVDFTENTMEAFESAIELGVDGIELDVHLNRDGVPIVVHNYLHDKNRDYLKLEEVLARFAGQCRLEVEIKALEDDAVEAVSKLVDKYRPVDLEVTSSAQPLLPMIAEYFPNDLRGIIFRRWLVEDWMTEAFKIHWVVRHMELLGANVLHLDPELYFGSLVEALHEKSFLAHAHLATDSKEVLDNLVELGIDQCTFDCPEVLSFR